MKEPSTDQVSRPQGAVAVVAVHGVADQQPGQSVRAVGNLLLRLRCNGVACYQAFEEVGLRIPLDPVRFRTAHAPSTAASRGTNERSAYVLDLLTGKGSETDPPPHHQFSRALLEGYPGSRDVYETVRLEGKRSDGQEVHLYELHWADLSRAGRGLLGVLSTFYQLAFHIPHLGRVALDHALFEHGGSVVWRVFARIHAWAVRAITLFLPVVALLMLLSVLTVLPSSLELSFLGDEKLPALIWVVGATAALAWLFGLYEGQRPGVRRWGGIMTGGLWLGPMVGVILASDGTRAEIASCALWVYEMLLRVSGLVASSFYLLALVSALCGLAAFLCTPRSSRHRAGKVVWTALASLALSTVGFYLVTLFLGIGTLVAGRNLLPEVPHPPLFAWTARFFVDEAPLLPDALRELLRLGATSGFVVLVAVTGLVILLAAWGLGPSVWSELSPPAGERAADPKRSEAQARWLNLAYPTVRLSVLGLFVGVFLLMPAASGLRMAGVSWAQPLWDASGWVLFGAGGLIAASAAGLVAFHGRLEWLALGFRPVIDVALDVDSYMRDLPRDRTPRAQMFERYVSLLRWLAAWQDASGRPYEKVVIVAHSQGSVLSVDLLDFVCREGDEDLPWTAASLPREAPRLYLFTMGSPLRQLYAQCFPHLYGWIVGEPWTVPAPSGAPEAAPAETWGHSVEHEIPESPPNPESLGLERWVNAYRTGDYVGRMLWRDPESYPDLFRTRTGKSAPPVKYTVSEDSSRRRRELCIGAGAHTHYWDATAEAVAEELDLLIGCET